MMIARFQTKVNEKKQEENKFKADYFSFIRDKKLGQDIEENKNNMSNFMLDLNTYVSQGA